MRRSNILKSEKAMKTTMSALAVVALVAATDVRARETGSSNTVQLPGSKDAKVTLVYQHALPGIPGKSVKGVLVEYGPGGYSPSHTHAKSALIYATVIEGEVRSKVNDGPERTYRTGENWTELPGDHHRVSANGERQSPPRFSRSLSLTIRTRCSRYPTKREASRPWLSSLPSHLSAISSHPVLFSKDIHAEGQG
jgi:quercetin dioxygenase-like cupin family protein